MDLPKKIYAIQHNVTKRIYVGSSKNVKERYMSHIYRLRKGNHHVEEMQKDFDEYGEDFSVFIVDEIQEFEDRFKEYEWMVKLNTLVRECGYNYNDQTTKKFLKSRVPYKEGIPEPKKM